MIRGRARRKTMKRPRLNPIVSPLPKENEENTRQAMAINAARPPGGEQGGAAMGVRERIFWVGRR